MGLDIPELIEGAINNRDAAHKLFAAGFGIEEVDDALPDNIKKGLVVKWHKEWDRQMNSLGFEEEKKEERKDITVATPDVNSALDRTAALAKSGMNKDDLAKEIVKREQRIAELEAMQMGNVQKGGNGGQSIQHNPTQMGSIIDNDLREFMKDMRRWEFQQRIVQDMMKGAHSKDSQENNKMDDRLYERLTNRIDRLEKRDELERAIKPLQKEIKALRTGNKTQLTPEVDRKMESFERTLEKLAEEKKWSKLESIVTKMSDKGKEDPLEYLKELEKMRLSYDKDSKDKDREIQATRDKVAEEKNKFMQMEIHGYLGKLEEELKRMKNTDSSDIDDIGKLTSKISKIKDAAQALGGEGKPKSTTDKLLEATLPKLAEGAAEIGKVMAENKMQQPQMPQDAIMMTPEEMALIKQMRGQDLKKNDVGPVEEGQSTKTRIETPVETYDPTQSETETPEDVYPDLINISSQSTTPDPGIHPKDIKVITDERGTQRYVAKGHRGFLSEDKVNEIVAKYKEQTA